MVKPPRRRSNRRRYALTLPELEHSKAAVLNSLGSLQSRRSYRHAIEEFIRWYCSEPRLALNRAVVLRYRLYLENIALAPSTINVRLAAIRRIAYEAADSGLLSPELVAGIRRVKGIKRLGQPVGNWLTVQQGRQLLATSREETIRGKRDRAMLALLLGCGLRRSELVTLKSDQVQKREDHWVIVDLIGKARHVRTVFCQFPAYSAESIVKLPQTARKYRESAVYEAVLMVDLRLRMPGRETAFETAKPT
jgi:site-specific recombinase XerD